MSSISPYELDSRSSDTKMFEVGLGPRSVRVSIGTGTFRNDNYSCITAYMY